MENKKHIRHEERDRNGRTLFVIDVLISEELYVWIEEDCSFFPCSMFFSEKDKKANDEIDGHYYFLNPSIVIHLPLRLEDKNNSVKIQKEKVFEYTLANPNDIKGIKSLLSELANAILNVPNVEKLFLPDFALNSKGDFDTSHMVKILEEIDDSYSPKDYKSILTEYVEYLFENIVTEGQIISKETNAELLQWIEFFLLFEKEDLVFKDIALADFLELAPNKRFLIDYFLDLIPTNGRMVLIEDLEDDEDLYIYLDRNDQPLCCMFNRRVA